MNKEELKWATVEHWLDIWQRANAGEFDNAEPGAIPSGAGDCAYCQKYAIGGLATCLECPVARHTKKTGCVGTPWVRVNEINSWTKPMPCRHTALVEAVEAEYVFLVEIALED